MQHTADVEEEGAVDVSSSSASLSAFNSPTGERRSETKQRINSISSAASLPSGTRGRTRVSGGGRGSPSPSVTSYSLTRQQGGARGTMRTSSTTGAEDAANQDISEKEKEEMDRETRLEMWVEYETVFPNKKKTKTGLHMRGK